MTTKEVADLLVAGSGRIDFYWNFFVVIAIALVGWLRLAVPYYLSCGSPGSETATRPCETARGRKLNETLQIDVDHSRVAGPQLQLPTRP